jgi:prepilin-type N-terminal cleavage/methylation domain-containing protein
MRNNVGWRRQGFTLIELPIVLVIIGLIVGGVLVGRDLISAAAVRAQVTQIEQFNTAANTFYGKYGYLPGDMPNPPAVSVGFAPRGQYRGEGDGKGVIEGVWQNASGDYTGIATMGGETTMFWADLSKANLIPGNFTAASSTTNLGALSVTGINALFPQAKLRSGWPCGRGGTANTFLHARVVRLGAAEYVVGNRFP